MEEAACETSTPDYDEAMALQEQLTLAFAEMSDAACSAVDHMVAVGRKPQKRWAKNFAALISLRSQFYASH